LERNDATTPVRTSPVPAVASDAGPKSETTTAFLARANGRRLTFREANATATELIDRETESRWDAYGNCTSGSLKGTQLEMLILEPEYWFAWSEFHPKTTIFEPARDR